MVSFVMSLECFLIYVNHLAPEMVLHVHFGILSMESFTETRRSAAHQDTLALLAADRHRSPVIRPGGHYSCHKCYTERLDQRENLLLGLLCSRSSYCNFQRIVVVRDTEIRKPAMCHSWHELFFLHGFQGAIHQIRQPLLNNSVHMLESYQSP